MDGVFPNSHPARLWTYSIRKFQPCDSSPNRYILSTRSVRILYRDLMGLWILPFGTTQRATELNRNVLPSYRFPSGPHRRQGLLSIVTINVWDCLFTKFDAQGPRRENRTHPTIARHAIRHTSTVDVVTLCGRGGIRTPGQWYVKPSLYR